MKDGVLTADDLNSKLIELRKVLAVGRSRLAQQIVRQIKKNKSRVEKSASGNAKANRKFERLAEDLGALKTLNLKEIVRSALMNKLTLADIKGDTPPQQRASIRLFSESLVVSWLSNFRAAFPGWEPTCAFIFQRLGTKRADAKLSAKLRKKTKSADASEPKSNSDEEVKEEVIPKKNAKNGSNQKKIQSPAATSETETRSPKAKPIIEKTVADSSDRKTTQKEKTKKVAKKKADAKVAKPAPKTSTDVLTSANPQAVIRRIDLSAADPFAEESAKRAPLEFNVPEEDGIEHDPFFLSSTSARTGGRAQRWDATGANAIQVAERNFHLDHDTGEDDLAEKPTKRRKIEPNAGTTRKKMAPVNNAEEESLHPSWIAKRQQRAALQALKPQGRRTVLAESDDEDD